MFVFAVCACITTEILENLCNMGKNKEMLTIFVFQVFVSVRLAFRTSHIHYSITAFRTRPIREHLSFTTV